MEHLWIPKFICVLESLNFNVINFLEVYGKEKTVNYPCSGHSPLFLGLCLMSRWAKKLQIKPKLVYLATK